MPRIKRISRRNRSEYNEKHVRALLSGHDFFAAFGRRDEPTTIDRMRAAWGDVGDSLLADYIAEHPGERPWAWWRFDSPEPRRQVRTNEEAAWEASGPADYWGMPHMFNPLHEGAGLSPPIGLVDHDEYEREPMYETQLAYLTRLGLLSNEERAALGM